MEIRQLRYFAVLAEELNFTRAAARLHISQPPLSLQIAQLERELEVKLFDRTNRRVALTEAGAAFLNDVRATLAGLKDATVRVRAVDQGRAGRVEIGLSGSHFMGPVPALIARQAASHPQVSVLLNEMNPAAQMEALRG
ncbi:LysR family transcriptional regulator, partial [Achromobacter xylosoxidans]